MKNNYLINLETHIWNNIQNDSRIGLLNGLSGPALLYSNIIKYNQNDYHDKFSYIINKILSIIETKEVVPSLCSGLSGFSYLLLNSQDKIDIHNSFFNEIDNILLSSINIQSKSFNYDFLHGALGISIYFLERYKRTKDTDILNFLKYFLDKLITIIHNNNLDIFSQKEENGSTSLYFGLAHGISGILNTINIFQSIGLLIDYRLPDIGNKIFHFLENHKLKNDVFLYPNHLNIDLDIYTPSRLAWCQGDLGIGMALLNHAKLNNNNILLNNALNIIERIKRIDLKSSGVNNIGICHGISGVLLLYFLLDNKDSQFLYWRNLLQKNTNNYTSFKFQYNNNYINETNIIEGSTGILMTLLTIDNKINKNWISCLNLM